MGMRGGVVKMLLRYPEELDARITEYKDAYNIRSKTQAIIILVTEALNSYQEKKRSNGL